MNQWGYCSVVVASGALVSTFSHNEGLNVVGLGIILLGLVFGAVTHKEA